MKIRAIDTTWFEHEGYKGNTYLPSNAKKGFNALTITVNGAHPKKKMIDTTRSYYVISGNGMFTIEGSVEQAGPGDLFIIEPGQTYEYEGEMRLFEFNVSPTNSFKDQRV